MNGHPDHGADGCQGRPGLGRAVVTRVDRIENTRLWRDYGHRKTSMLHSTQGVQHSNRCLRSQSYNVGGVRAAPAPVDMPLHEVINADINEVFLFHGTSRPSSTNIITEHGFNERVSRDGL